jgi:acyl dehydratase
MSGTARGWDGLEIGDSLPVVELFLSREQVRAYARAAGMTAARFTDEEGARREGLPGIITPGNMTLGLLHKRLEDHGGGAVVRRLGVTFRGLLLPDQTIRLCANVVGVRGEAGGRWVDVDLWIESAAGERLVTGVAAVLVPGPVG